MRSFRNQVGGRVSLRLSWRTRIDEIGPVEGAATASPDAASRALEILCAMVFKANKEWGASAKYQLLSRHLQEPAPQNRPASRRQRTRTTGSRSRHPRWPAPGTAIRFLALTGSPRGEELDQRDTGNDPPSRQRYRAADRAAHRLGKMPVPSRSPASGAPTPSCSRDTPKTKDSSSSLGARAQRTKTRISVGCDSTTFATPMPAMPSCPTKTCP